jgi:hypothetical protein
VAGVRGETGDAAALAPEARCQELDVSAPASRPPSDRNSLRELILRLGEQRLGYVRIVGELRKLGIDVSATLVRNVLGNAGIPPAPPGGTRRTDLNGIRVTHRPDR